MKVDRIVGMKDMTMDEILNYRKSFYESSYDYNFKIDWNLNDDEIFEEFVRFLDKVEY